MFRGSYPTTTTVVGIMASESKSSTLPSGTATSNTILVGISGPSSSGKTTIARLLRRIFSVPQLDGASEKEVGIETFIVHEDDFYHTDDKYELSSLWNYCVCCF